MLTRNRAYLEQPRLGFLEPCRFVSQRLGRSGEGLLGIRSLDQRAVERGNGLCEPVVLVADSLEPAQSLAKQGQATVRSVEQLADGGNILGEARAFLHVGAKSGEGFFLARFRRQLGELGDAMLEP